MFMDPEESKWMDKKHRRVNPEARVMDVSRLQVEHYSPVTRRAWSEGWWWACAIVGPLCFFGGWIFRAFLEGGGW